MPWHQDPTRVVPLLVALLGLFVGVSGFFEVGQTLVTAATYETTTGHIVKSRAEYRYRKGMDWEARVDFTWQVDGQSFRSRRLSWQHSELHYRRFDTQALAEAEVARWPVGTAVTVSYDPVRPGRGVIERTLLPSSVGKIVVGVALFVVGLVIGLWFTPRAADG